MIGDDRVSITKSKNSFNPPPISPYSNDVMAFQVVAASALQVPPPTLPWPRCSPRATWRQEPS